jgi:hypothetical protein
LEADSSYSRARREREIPAREPEISRSYFQSPSAERQAAGNSVLLRFFRFGILPLRFGEGHGRRLGRQADSDGVQLQKRLTSG